MTHPGVWVRTIDLHKPPGYVAGTEVPFIKVLAAKGYHYQFVFARNAGHVDRPTVAQTLPAALEWVWQGYKPR